MQVVLREELHGIKQSGKLAIVSTECVAPDLLDITQELGSVMVSSLNGMAYKTPHFLIVTWQHWSGCQKHKENRCLRRFWPITSLNLLLYRTVTEL